MIMTLLVMNGWILLTTTSIISAKKDYYNFRILREAGLVNPRPTLPTLSYKRHSPISNIKRPIKFNPGPPKLDMMTPLCNETKLIAWVNTENIFFIPAPGIMINKDQEIKEVLETSRFSPSNEPYTMGCHSDTLLYYD